MPSQCNEASTIVAFRLARLSPCSTGRVGMACIPSASPARQAKWAACSALSLSCTSKPTTLRGPGSGKGRTMRPRTYAGRNITSQHQISLGRVTMCVRGGPDVIHPSCGDQRLQSSRRRPALAASSPIARSIGQRVRTPTLQRRCTHSNLARHLLYRRTLRWQQSRHDPILVSLCPYRATS